MRKLSEFLFRMPAQPINSDALENHRAHGYLGNMYLSLGDLAEAELEYSRAYAFLPSAEVRSKLAAIRKRRSAQRLSVDRSAIATRAA